MLKRLGLQFFAEDDGGDPPPADAGSKTFTQDEVNAMLRKEKLTAKASTLKELGVDTLESGKDKLGKYQLLLDNSKSDIDQAKEKLSLETLGREAAEKKTQLAEVKLEILVAGAKPEHLDDLITLALSRITETTDLKTVLEEMKKSAYAPFFVQDGTGGGQGYKKGSPGTKGSLGTRLGTKPPIKNPYFNN